MRRMVLAAGLMALGALATLIAATREKPAASPPRAIVPGVAYVLNVEGDRAEVDLEFGPNTRYVAVISSLARSVGTFTVVGRPETIASAQFVPSRVAHNPSAAAHAHSVRSSAAGSASAIPAEGPHLHSSGPASRPESRLRPLAKSNAFNGPVQSGGSRSFALHVTDGSLDDPSQYAKVTAHEVAIGRSVRVYLDDQQSTQELPQGLVSNIADLFDNELIPKFRGAFGSFRDVDGDGRFLVLLSPWLARLQGGRTSVGGFVRGSDFQPRVAAPFSNRCDMMYVNSQTVPGPHLRTLLIHEYAHAVSFSRRTDDHPGPAPFPDEEDWLNEALAHCAESLFNGGWTNLDYRISRYLNDPAAYPLVVEDYYRAGLWRCHGCRGATYLFLRYCVERFGTQVLTRIIATPARGTRNLELATGCSFESLFRDWTLSLIEGSQGPDTVGQQNSAQVPATNGPALAAPQNTAALVAHQNTAALVAHQNTDQLAQLDLRGALGSWGLAGPRFQKWDLDGGPLKLELKGTSAAFVEISASHQPGFRRIHLNGTRGMRLEVSFVRLGDDTPRIDVEGAWSQPARGSAQRSPGDTAADGNLHTVVRIDGGDDLVIQQVSAEQNAEDSRVSAYFSRESLKALEVPAGPTASASPGPQPAAAARRCHVFELPGTQFTSATCPVIIKVVALDRQGRRTSGWATVPPGATPRVASLTARRP
jgi:hypothetical protein